MDRKREDKQLILRYRRENHVHTDIIIHAHCVCVSDEIDNIEQLITFDDKSKFIATHN